MTTRCREFIEAEKQAGGNVVKACDLLQASRSAFYAWHQHVPSNRALRRPAHREDPRRPLGQQGDLRGAQGARRTRQKAPGWSACARPRPR